MHVLRIVHKITPVAVGFRTFLGFELDMLHTWIKFEPEHVLIFVSSITIAVHFLCEQ